MKKVLSIAITMIFTLSSFSQTNNSISIVKLIYNNSTDSIFYPSQRLNLLFEITNCLVFS